MDLVMTVPSLPDRGGDILASSASYYPGGGFNVLTAARRQGLEVLYAGRIGQGPLGDHIWTRCHQEHIACLWPPTDEGDTGFDIALVEPGGERTFVTFPGVESRIGTEHLVPLQVAEGDVLYLSGYDLLYPISGPTIVDFLRGMPFEVRLIFDPGPLVLAIPKDRLNLVLKRSWLVTANRNEMTRLTGCGDPALAAQDLSSKLLKGSIVVARDGAEGAFVSADGVLSHVPSRPTRPKDTTGAGDTHTGVLVARLSQGDPLLKAVRAANVAAALSVEEAGPATCPSADRLASDLKKLGED